MKIYRFPDNLPDRCKLCPANQPAITEWYRLTMTASAILWRNLTNSVEDMANSIPDELLEQVGVMRGETLDPALPSDRKKGVMTARAVSSVTGRNMSASTDSIQESVETRVANCQNKGPLTIRVPLSQGPVRVTLCQSEIQGSRDSETPPLTGNVYIAPDNG